MADDAPIVRCYEMTISRSDFLRLLPAAVDYAAFSVSGDAMGYEADGRAWRIQLTPLDDLVLGLIRLPRHRVEFAFTGYGEEAVAAFMRRFDLYFRRGGG